MPSAAARAQGHIARRHLESAVGLPSSMAQTDAGGAFPVAVAIGAARWRGRMLRAACSRQRCYAAGVGLRKGLHLLQLEEQQGYDGADSEGSQEGGARA